MVRSSYRLSSPEMFEGHLLTLQTFTLSRIFRTLIDSPFPLSEDIWIYHDFPLHRALRVPLHLAVGDSHPSRKLPLVDPSFVTTSLSPRKGRSLLNL